MSTSTAAPTLVEQADAKAMAEAARKVETVGGSVKLVLKKPARGSMRKGDGR